MKRTPLYDCHAELGAKFTDFGGWEMPILYSSIKNEHEAVRTQAGLFDVSHMGEVLVRGENAEAYLQYVTSNDVSKLTDGKAQYSLLLNSGGGVVDDLIVYRKGENEFLLCVNAANSDKDFEWLTQHNTFDVEVIDQSAQYAQVAVQGPKARDVVISLADDPSRGTLASLAFFRFADVTLEIEGKTIPVTAAATGYTGEDGFEVFCQAADGALLWRCLLNNPAGIEVTPCGLGARDTLRLEACLPLHGHELGDDLCALFSGLGWVVKFNKGDFIGREALLRRKELGLERILVGLEVQAPGIVREGAVVFSRDGKEVGWVTSGTKTPTLPKPVCLAYVSREKSAEGMELEAEVRGRKIPVSVVKTPFYRRS